ncbi:hypothetical protein [Brucella pseudintermedia]|uniref:hypothetical protein n=1 Tax=Brucella pseudintermedia TaxID=370111 RepID=UPI00124E5838|nr:hypothetical protein [Brucella pseudintermedia]KAB2680882.1 hypothetical protein F9K78_14805 [Brucella pseudintermedia]
MDRAKQAGSLCRLIEKVEIVFHIDVEAGHGAHRLVIFFAYGAFAAVVRRQVTSGASVQTWMRRGIEASFAGLAVQLAFTLC